MKLINKVVQYFFSQNQSTEDVVTVGDIQNDMQRRRQEREERRQRTRAQLETLVGKRVIVRSNEDEPLHAGRCTGIMEITRAKDPVPIVVDDDGSDYIVLGLIVPEEPWFYQMLEGKSSQEQWDLLVPYDFNRIGN